MKPSNVHSRAFTLVELMISLGIALLLMYGINLVFRAVTDTVRVGNALAVATRKMRSIDSSLTIDFEGTQSEINPLTNTVVAGGQPDINRRWSGITPTVGNIDPINPGGYETEPRQPAITIFCKRQYAFLNKADYEDDADKIAATYDESDTGTVTNFADPANAARIGQRVHRLDTIGFFAGGSFAPTSLRGTAASGTAAQAWIWYGHTLQFGGPGATANPVVSKTADLKPALGFAPPTTPPGRFYQPGAGSETDNPNNFYAADWVLGRTAMVLLPRLNADVTFPGIPTLGQPTAKPVYRTYAQTLASPTAIDFSNSESNVTPASTYDLASGDVQEWVPKDTAMAGMPFTSGLNTAVSVWLGQPGNAAILPTGSIGTTKTATETGSGYDQALFKGLLRHYTKLANTPSAAATWWQRSLLENNDVQVPLRFNVVSAFTRAVGVDGILSTTDKTALQSLYLAKGCTQFIVEFAGDYVTQAGANSGTIGPDGEIDYVVDASGNRSIRWYGLPRDIDGDGQATANSPDVMRVSDFVAGTYNFEKTVPKSANEYIVAFGPNELYPQGKTAKESQRPWLIRITVGLTDPDGSLPTGYTREYVFKVR